jgi:hypothetical protein
MRTILAPVVGVMTIAAISAQAAPLTPSKAAAPPAMEPARDDCGHGWHCMGWCDRWGYWHWGNCVPNGNPHAGWGTG